MKNITVIPSTTNLLPKKQRVAAYARVSIETERLMNSLSAQISYYSEFIQSNSNWEYVGVYSDKFLSGTSTEKRPELQRLIKDCMEGKIDIVLCKSISRFARNTVDLLRIVRQLKNKGVDVRFEKENISTLSESGEIMLTLLASYAQEESITISENVKWGFRKRYAEGTKIPNSKRVFGYYHNGEKYVIVPEEAEAVRYIFNRYLEGIGCRTIARELTKMGVRSIKGNELYELSQIHSIMVNPIYVGDIVWQRYYIADPLTKKIARNRGELPKYIIKDCHEAIVSRDIFEAVQIEIKRRAEKWETSALSHKLKCDVCGKYYVRKKEKYGNGFYVSWFCGGKREGIKCNSGYLNETRLKSVIAYYLNIPTFDEEIFKAEIKEITVMKDTSLVFYYKNGDIKEWISLTNRPYDCADLSAFFKGRIKCECCGNYYNRKKNHGNRGNWFCSGKNKKATKDSLHGMNYNESDLARICAYILNIEKYDEKAFVERIEEIIVYTNGDLLFYLKDGSEKLWKRLS